MQIILDPHQAERHFHGYGSINGKPAIVTQFKVDHNVDYNSMRTELTIHVICDQLTEDDFNDSHAYPAPTLLMHNPSPDRRLDVGKL